MSTRAAIARKTEPGFAGVYHHLDGYPTALGKTLFQAAQTMPMHALTKLLIDDHPAGWSTINDADLTLAPGFTEDHEVRTSKSENGERNPECFCHGDRAEEAMPIDEMEDAGMEWAYVLDGETQTITVFERVYNGQHGTGYFGLGPTPVEWAERIVVDIHGQEPDWEKVGG